MSTNKIKLEDLKETHFCCDYCKHMGSIKNSAMVKFEDGITQICPYCVEKTKELRDRLPILEQF